MILTHAKKKLPKDDEVGVHLAKSLFRIGYIPGCRKALFEVLDRSPANGGAVKIDLAFDLLSGSIVSHILQAATEQDKSIGKEFIIEVRRGDLVLRDMGYFSLPVPINVSMTIFFCTGLTTFLNSLPSGSVCRASGRPPAA